MTKEWLSEIEGRWKKTTPGPWVNFPVGGPWEYPGVIGASNESEPAYPRICTPVTDGNPDDMEFIAGAHEDVPRLIARVRELEAALEAYAAPDAPAVRDSASP